MKSKLPIQTAFKLALLVSSASFAMAQPVATSEMKVATAAASNATTALTPKYLTKGSILKIKAAVTTSGKWTYSKFDESIVDHYSENEFAEETLTLESGSSYGDSDGDKFSFQFKKIDGFTARVTFDQTFAGGGDTLANERGKGKFYLLFTSYDEATKTLFGTFVWSDSYKGYGWYDAESVMGNYVDSSTASGIFSLKLK